MKSFSRVGRLTACFAFTFAPLAVLAAPEAKPAIPPATRPTTNPTFPKAMEGWKVEVLAQMPQKGDWPESSKLPLIHYPSVVCAAPDGRVFVAEDPVDMLGPAEKPGDRILCFHPDGHISVFAENLYAVFGLVYMDGKLYVHHCPKLSVFTDDNSVGKNRVDLINTTNPHPAGGMNDHIPASIRLAMDGYLYMAVGDKGVFGAESNIDHRKAELKGGGLLRIRPDGTDMEVYATGTRNHLDVSVTPEDEMFTLDNTDDGLGWDTRFTHMVDGGFYGYPYDYRPHQSDPEAVNKWREDKKKDKPYRPFTLWRTEEYGGGSPTGAISYNEDALPVEYRGNVFHCEWGNRKLYRMQLQRDGGTFKVLKKHDFLTNGSVEFRPVGICLTPDGMGFYITDWNYSGWSNPNAVSGRFLKVTYTGPSLAAPKPAWFVPASLGQKIEASTPELLAGLAHPAESVRLVAQRRLAERAAEATPMLVALLADPGAPERARWSAIWTLDRIDAGKSGRSAIMSVLKDDKVEMSVRMQAARQLGTRAAKEAVPALISTLNSGDAALRFRSATALGRVGETAAVQPLLDKLTETDLFTHFAIFNALNRIGKTNPSAWEGIVKGLSSDRPEVRAGVVLALRETYDEQLVKVLVNYFATTANPPEGRAAAISALTPMARKQKPWNGDWWRTQPENSLPPAKEVEWAGTPGVSEAVRAGLNDGSQDVRLAVLNGLATAPDPTLGDTLVALFNKESDAAIRKGVLRALANAKSKAATPVVSTILKETTTTTPLALEAINVAKLVGGQPMNEALAELVGRVDAPELLVPALEAMLEAKDAKSIPVLARRLSHDEPKVAIAAANALAALGGKEVVEPLSGALKAKKPEVRRAAAEALGKVKLPEGIDPLLEAVKDKEVEREAISALTQTPDLKALSAYLSGLENRDGGVRDRSRRAIEKFRDQALPLIEKRLEGEPLSAQAMNELKQIFTPIVPEDKRKGNKIFEYDTSKLSPENFMAFAKSHHGDVESGKRIFQTNASAACARCHKVGNDGGEVGPSLSGVGLKYDRQFLIESVLYPSKQILDGYQQTLVFQNNGTDVSGIIKAETDADLTLVDTNGQKIVVKKKDIESKKTSAVSLMPEGVFTGLKPEEFADLIAYLESLKEKPPEKK